MVGHYSTDGTDVDPGRAAGAAAGERQDRPVRVLQRRRRQPDRGVRLVHAHGDQVGGGGGGGTPSGPSYDDQFDDATLDKTRWNAIVRDTPSQYRSAGGELKYTLSMGDIYTGDTNPPPNNFILQDASHAGADWVIETKINEYTHDGGYAQGGLLAYVDGDNYVKFDAITDPGATRRNRIELRSEVAGAIQNPQQNANLTGGPGRWPDLAAVDEGRHQLLGRVLVRRRRVDAVPGRAGPERDGRAGLRHLRVRPAGVGVGDTVTFDYFQLDGPDPSGCEECTGPGDDFAGSSLNASRWNAIAHDDPTKYAVSNGALKVTTTAGEIYQGITGGGPLILQAADHAGAD